MYVVGKIKWLVLFLLIHGRENYKITMALRKFKDVKKKKLISIHNVDGLVLWYINHCRLFNAKSCLYMHIKYIGFVNTFC